MLTVLADSSGQIGISSPEGIARSGADSFLIGTLLTLQAYTMLRLNQFDKGVAPGHAGARYVRFDQLV